MRKKTSFIAVLVAVIIVVCVGALVIVFNPFNKSPESTSNLLPSGNSPEWVVKLTGSVAQEKTFTLQDLTQMPLSNVTTKDNSTTYIGVSLFDFCNQSNMNWDAGYVQVIGENDNSTIINLYQAWNSTKEEWYYYKYNIILLAFVKNGQWMTNQTDGGSVKLITPHFNESYQIRSVSQISIKPWTITITGKVANPITLTAANMSRIQSTTINAAVGSSTVASNWTGILIMDALNYANVSRYAQQVTLVGIDGKTCLGVSVIGNFTLDEVTAANMMIGYQQDGKTLTIDHGGPFKSFCPTTVQPFKFATYWMKWLHEIIVY